jgi:hypothetical protein
MTNLKTKESVRNKKITAKQAYDRLLPLVGEKYAKSLPTMRWLNNLIHGRVIKEDKQSRQERKEAFRKKFKK